MTAAVSHERAPHGVVRGFECRATDAMPYDIAAALGYSRHDVTAVVPPAARAFARDARANGRQHYFSAKEERRTTETTEVLYLPDCSRGTARCVLTVVLRSSSVLKNLPLWLRIDLRGVARSEAIP